MGNRSGASPTSPDHRRRSRREIAVAGRDRGTAVLTLGLAHLAAADTIRATLQAGAATPWVPTLLQCLVRPLVCVASLVAAVDEPAVRAVVEAVTTMARALGLTLVAEGVEHRCPPRPGTARAGTGSSPTER